jgi:hypothetical protein
MIILFIVILAFSISTTNLEVKKFLQLFLVAGLFMTAVIKFFKKL